MRSNREVSEMMKVDLTEAEKREHSAQMARDIQTLGKHRDELKEIQASYKHKIAVAEASMNREADLINQGWEMRSIRCYWELNTPTKGEKTLYRVDNDAMVRTTTMSSEDHQLVLKLEADAEVDAMAQTEGGEAANDESSDEFTQVKIDEDGNMDTGGAIPDSDADADWENEFPIKAPVEAELVEAE